jgi:two-component system, cell cycle sensor histidine kinase and response regulator CckA
MIPPPNAPRFRLLRYFTLTSLAAFLLLAAPMTYIERLRENSVESLLGEQSRNFRLAQSDFAKQQEEVALRDLLTSQEAGNVNLARVFANALWEQHFAPFVSMAQRIRTGHCNAIGDGSSAPTQTAGKKACYLEVGRQIVALPGFHNLNARVFETMNKSTVFKVKLYDLRGITVYSSDHRQIGEDKQGNAGWRQAVAGKPASELVHREKFDAFEGVVANRDLIFSYLPVSNAAGKIVGVFEIYSDVTPLLEQIKNTLAHARSLGAQRQTRMDMAIAASAASAHENTTLQRVLVYASLALLFLALFLIVRYGQRTIYRQDAERTEALAALQESEARYRNLIEWSPDPIIVYRDGKTLYANPATIRMFGVSSAQQQTGFSILERIHPDFHESARARMKRFNEGNTVAPMAEITVLKFDGTAVEVEIQSILITYQGKSAVYALLRDITERKRSEADRASLETQLRESQKMQAIGTLAGGIAHDFNNILATILGNTELALSDVIGNTPALESLTEIRKAASRARDLVQQILSFSRRQPTERQRIALAPVIEESARLLRATLPARICLDVHCGDEVPAVLADATQIQQVLLNLAANAMHAMQGKPGHIDMRLDTLLPDAALAETHPALQALLRRKPGRVVRIRVIDDGCGMDSATVARIFEPFFTTKPVDEGTGLGLAVVHGIVQTHEGATMVESEPGKGSCFTIYLPAADQASAAAATQAGELPGVIVAPARGQNRRILYLDDDESLVFLVTRLLERRGYRISAYTDQRKALDALRTDPAAFDLVVTDYNMPGMSGLDVAREVRAIRADLPVAITSGFIDESLRTQADAAGVCELIFKANAVEELCEAFERLAGGTREKLEND